MVAAASAAEQPILCRPARSVNPLGPGHVPRLTAKESVHQDAGGVSDLLILHQTDTPNSYRLIKRPITKSCMCSVLEKEIVRRTNRLIRVRKLICLLSIFCVFAFPTVCCLASTCRS